MNQKIVTLSVGAAVAVTYWLFSMYKKGDCGLEDLVIAVMSAVGTVTGVYIFVGSFTADTFSQNAIWGGITGVCMTLYTFKKIITKFQEIVICVVPPRTTIEDEPKVGSKGN